MGFHSGANCFEVLEASLDGFDAQGGEDRNLVRRPSHNGEHILICLQKFGAVEVVQVELSESGSQTHRREPPMRPGPIIRRVGFTAMYSSQRWLRREDPFRRVFIVMAIEIGDG